MEQCLANTGINIYALAALAALSMALAIAILVVYKKRLNPNTKLGRSLFVLGAATTLLFSQPALAATTNDCPSPTEAAASSQQEEAGDGDASEERQPTISIIDGETIAFTAVNLYTGGGEIYGGTSYTPGARTILATSGMNGSSPIKPVQNATAYNGATIVASLVDLDVDTPGVQHETQITIAAGGENASVTAVYDPTLDEIFIVVVDVSDSFAALIASLGTAGTLSVSPLRYTVTDSDGLISQPATISLQVGYAEIQ